MMPRVEKPFAWTLFLLLLTSIAINYIDRGALAIAVPSMRVELHLSPIQLGWLLSAFFWTYACAQPVSGTLIDRYGTKYVFAIAFLLWSVATAAIGAVHSYSALIVLRLILGLGESVAYPAYSKILTEDFSPRWRGLLNALIDACSRIGPAASTMLGVALISRYGWRGLFLSLGLVGLLWLVPWLLLSPGKQKPSTAQLEPFTFRELLGIRAVWLTSGGMFCFGYGWFFLVSWLPQYLISDRQLSLKQVGISGSIPFWAMAFTAVLSGWLSDWICRRKRSAAPVRRNFVVLGLVAGALLLSCTALVRSADTSLLLLVLTCAALGVTSSNLWALTQTLAGARWAASWTGIQNAIGNFGGVASPLITGYLYNQSHSFTSAMLITSGTFLSGAFLFSVCLRDHPGLA